MFVCEAHAHIRQVHASVVTRVRLGNQYTSLSLISGFDKRIFRMAIVKVQQICNEMYAWTLMFWSVKENEIKLKKTTCRDYVPVNGFYMPNIFTVLLYTVKKLIY